VHTTGHEDLFYEDSMRNDDGAFRFAENALGTFWTRYLEAMKHLYGHLTFPSTVIAGQKVITALKDLLDDLDARESQGQPRGNQDQASSNGRDRLQRQTIGHDKEKDPGEPGSRKKCANGMTQDNAAMEPEAIMSDMNTLDTMQHPDSPEDEEKRNIADQVISMTLGDSGISMKDAEKQERKNITSIQKKLKNAANNPEKLQKALKTLLKTSESNLNSLINEAAKEEPGAEKGHDERITAMDSHDGDEILVDKIDDVVQLREFNNIDDPLKVYNDIVKENNYTIKQLRKALARIKVNHTMQRGARKGAICDRDLPRVVSSKGRFNRPFMAKWEKAGASLLIVIDESASMSTDECCKRMMREDADYTCRRSKDCTVHKDCPDRDFCECSGVWPKDYGMECDLIEQCPMHKQMVTDDSDGVDMFKDLPIYIAKKSAIILAEALKDTRIDFGVVGFSAIGGKKIIVEKIYKKLEEQANPKKLGSIGVSFESGENRDGTSFKVIAQRHFQNCQRKVPIMIIISDGEPQHGGTEYMGEVAERMTAQAIQALKQKIKLFAISIDQAGRNYLRDIYGSENYIVLDDPKEITEKLIYLVKNIAAAIC
nr:hypothetical protein [Candidatus Sigynarchaeota archaeon]